MWARSPPRTRRAHEAAPGTRPNGVVVGVVVLVDVGGVVVGGVGGRCPGGDTGLDGPEPRPRMYVGSEPPAWGPLMQRAQQLAAGEMVPAGVTQPEVLPMIARVVRSQIMFRGAM